MKFTFVTGLLFLALFNMVICENEDVEAINKKNQLDEEMNQDQLIESLMERLVDKVGSYDSTEQFDRDQRSLRPSSDLIYNLFNAYFEKMRDSRGGLSKMRKFWKRNYRNRYNKMFWK
jgi:hypothetical protein